MTEAERWPNESHRDFCSRSIVSSPRATLARSSDYTNTQVHTISWIAVSLTDRSAPFVVSRHGRRRRRFVWTPLWRPHVIRERESRASAGKVEAGRQNKCSLWRSLCWSPDAKAVQRERNFTKRVALARGGTERDSKSEVSAASRLVESNPKRSFPSRVLYGERTGEDGEHQAPGWPDQVHGCARCEKNRAASDE